LGSGNGVSFKTPLGINRAFNGWADQFLTLPPEGLQDFSVAAGEALRVKMDVMYHNFEVDDGAVDMVMSLTSC